MGEIKKEDTRNYVTDIKPELELKSENEQQMHLQIAKPLVKVKVEPYGQENQNLYQINLPSRPLQMNTQPSALKMKRENLLQPKSVTTPYHIPSQLKSVTVLKTELTSDPIFKCGLCKQVAFQSKAELKAHFSSCKLTELQIKSEPLEEDVQTLYSCGLCQFKVKQKRLMTEHWVSGCTKMFSKIVSNSAKSIRL